MPGQSRCTNRSCRRLHRGRGLCPDCRLLPEYQRGTTAQRGYGSRWQRASRQAIEDWVDANGWVCPGWGCDPHTVEPGNLTGDHGVPLARGGDRLPEVIGVLCRPCNSRKRDRTGGRGRPDHGDPGVGP